MNNYTMKIRFRDVEYSEEDMFKIMSNCVAFNFYLYSLDYHGYENGICFEVENNEYFIIIIVNNDPNFDGVDDIVEEVKGVIKRRNYILDKWDVTIIRSEEKLEIPENFIEQYYVNSYPL